MQRMKHLFFVFILTLVFASSAWSVDFNCPGGSWVAIKALDTYCTVYTASVNQTFVVTSMYLCAGDIIDGGKLTKKYAANGGYIVSGTLSGYPFCEPNPCGAPSTWGWIAEYEWKCPCTAGQTQPCPYFGPAGTENVGICRAGTQTCVNGQWGSCQGEIIPQTEVCGDGIDNNCNGKIDEGCGIELPETVYQCEDKFKTTPPYYDTTTKSICDKGCLLSSLTMVLDYYLNKKGLPMVDVEKLNEWLKNNKGFDSDGRINRDAIKQYPDADVFYDRKGSNTANKDTIDKELADGHPVILNVKDGNHFVIAIDKEGDTYKIIDPGHKPQTTTLNERYNNKFNDIRIFRPR